MPEGFFSTNESKEDRVPIESPDRKLALMTKESSLERLKHVDQQPSFRTIGISPDNKSKATDNQPGGGKGSSLLNLIKGTDQPKQHSLGSIVQGMGNQTNLKDQVRPKTAHPKYTAPSPAPVTLSLQMH